MRLSEVVTPRETPPDEPRPATRLCESSSPGTGKPHLIQRRLGAVPALRHRYPGAAHTACGVPRLPRSRVIDANDEIAGFSYHYPVRFAGAARISKVYPNADATPTIVVKAGLPLSLRALYRLSRPRPQRFATRGSPGLGPAREPRHGRRAAVGIDLNDSADLLRPDKDDRKHMISSFRDNFSSFSTHSWFGSPCLAGHGHSVQPGCPGSSGTLQRLTGVRLKAKMRFDVEHYLSPAGRDPFQQWLDGLSGTPMSSGGTATC